MQCEGYRVLVQVNTFVGCPYIIYTYIWTLEAASAHAHPRPCRELRPVTDDLDDFSSTSISEDWGTGVGGFLKEQVMAGPDIRNTHVIYREEVWAKPPIALCGSFTGCKSVLLHYSSS